MFNKKITKFRLLMYGFGAMLIIFFSLFISAGIYKEDGSIPVISELMENYGYYANHIIEIFKFKFVNSRFFAICIFFSIIYICLIMISLLKSNKYIRGREYGSAEWDDLNRVSSKLVKGSKGQKLYYDNCEEE